MESASEQDRAGWRSVLAALLWVIVAIGGLSLVVPLSDTLLYVIGGLLLSGDPPATVMDRYRLVSVRNIGLIFYGLVWLGGIIALYTYYSSAKTTGELLKRLFVVLAVEAGVWGLAFLAQTLILS